MPIGMQLLAVHELYLRLEKCIHNGPVDPNNQEILQLLYNQVESVLMFCRRAVRTDLGLSEYCKRLDTLVTLIENGDKCPSAKVQDVIKEINAYNPQLRTLEEGLFDFLYDSFSDHEKEEEEEEGNAVSSEIIGLSDVYQELKLSLMSDEIVTSLDGMAGIGKTTLANKVFHDPEIVEQFDHHVWVRVGKRCHFKDVPRLILAEMDPGVVHANAGEEISKLKERLESERCLVVLDDVWDRYMAHFLAFLWEEHHILIWENGSRFLVVSRLQQQYGARSISLRLMDKDESWKLLCGKVFSQGLCPRELEKAGEKIAENCEGLPLTILAVAALLSQREKTLDFWNEVALKKNHQVFKDAYDQISEVLLPSYTYLPRVLQICFLFMGLFRQNYKVPRTKLINLWNADGFDEFGIILELDFYANRFLEELDRNSLVMVYQKSSFNQDHSIKTCGLHSSLWHLSNKIATESNFSIVLNSVNDCLDDAIEDHRRLSFHNNVLFGIKDVSEWVESKCAPTARSLLCYGPYHQYQVPLCYRLELLRELDAVSIRFYEFPVEVLKLVELRYLTLTVNGMIPPSISQLSKLQFLVVDRHLNIRSCNGPSYLPVEIWELEELKHLEVTGSDLPDPCGNYLSNLHTLLNVSDSSCTDAVLKAIPNLKELGIRIEWASGDDGELINCFHHISHHLEPLDSLKCVVVNPGVAHPIVPFSVYRSLSKLSLSGMGYPWEEMSKISSLANLEVLKLKNNAFVGPVWELGEEKLNSLCTVVIEDADIVEWKIGNGKLTRLEHLKLKHCYRFEKIQGTFGWHVVIEVVDCNPVFVYEMNKALLEERVPKCAVEVQFSWEEH